MFLLRGFYAHKDTKTPFKINVVENLINIALAFVLVDRYGVLGLGPAFALAYVISSLWSMQILSYKVPGFAVGPLLSSIGRMLLASVLMAEAMWLVTQQVGGNAGVDAVIRLVVGTIAGTAVYLGVLVLLKAPELDAVRRRLRPSCAPRTSALTTFACGFSRDGSSETPRKREWRGWVFTWGGRRGRRGGRPRD